MATRTEILQYIKDRDADLLNKKREKANQFFNKLTSDLFVKIKEDKNSTESTYLLVNIEDVAKSDPDIYLIFRINHHIEEVDKTLLDLCESNGFEIGDKRNDLKISFALKQ